MRLLSLRFEHHRQVLRAQIQLVNGSKTRGLKIEEPFQLLQLFFGQLRPAVRTFALNSSIVVPSDSTMIALSLIPG